MSLWQGIWGKALKAIYITLHRCVYSHPSTYLTSNVVIIGMKILLIGNYKPDKIESMDRFASMLETHLTELGHEVKIIRPQVYFGQLFSSRKTLQKYLGYIDKFIIFPAKLGKLLEWADIVHICDQGNGIYANYLQNKPNIATCHDLFPIRSGMGEFPNYRTPISGRILQRITLLGLNKVHKIACVSQQTQIDAIRICSQCDRDISWIPLGLNYPYSPMSAFQAQIYLKNIGIPCNSPFIIHIGANHWYKNRLGVLSIFSEIIKQKSELTSELKLVMVGPPMTAEMQQFIQKKHLSARVIGLTNIDNETLRSLYSSATAMLFPSLQEGFGWPILEAHACGCPVFASDIPPMNQVGGSAAIYIDPENHSAAATKIIEYLPNIKQFQSLSLENSQRFSTQKMIEAYVELYAQAIEEFHQNRAIASNFLGLKLLSKTCGIR